MAATGVWCALWLFAAVQFAVVFQVHGHGHGCEWKDKQYIMGTTIEFACPFGYKLSTRDNSRICSINGWRPLPMPICKRTGGSAMAGRYKYPDQCPSDWNDWSPCDATECGKEGKRIRLKGTVQEIIFSGSQTIFAQCNLATDMAVCTKPCPALRAKPHPKSAADPNDNEEPTIAVTESRPASTTSENSAEAVTPTRRESTPEEIATIDEGSTSVVPATESEEVTVNVLTEVATDQLDTETMAKNAEATTESAHADLVTTESNNFAPQQPITIVDQPSDPPATQQATSRGEEGSGASPTCIEPQPVSPDGSFCEFQGELFHQGSRLNYQCPPGWRRSGRVTQKCRNSEGNLRWTGKQPVCVNEEVGVQCPSEGLWGKCDKECEDNPGVGNRRRLVYSYESENVCNKTYRVRCVATEETEPCRGNRFCQPRSCPPIPNRPNANIVILKQGASRAQFDDGTTVYIECDENYEADSFQHLVCQNGYWSDPVPNCQPIQKRSCKHPQLPFGGQCVPTQSLHPIGDVVTCTCTLAKHGNSGTAIRVCREDQTWSGRQTTCVAGHRACPDPGIPENGNRYGHSFQPGESVSFTCNPGYHIEGKGFVTCLENGSWSGAISRCVYNFQPVATLIRRFENRNCSSQDLCPCLPVQSCQSCHRERGFYYGLQDVHEPCCGLCLGCCLELVFVFDESSSISVRNFHGAIRFAREVIEAQVNGAERGRGCVRAAGIAFSHEARNLSTGLVDAEELLRLANSDDRHWLANGTLPRGGPTGTRCGLSAARALFKRGARSSCRKVLFLVTDGHANWCGSPINIANKLKCHHCTELFVVGIGSNVNYQKLSHLPSKIAKGHLFLLRQFRDLHQLGAAFLHRNVHL